MVDKKDEPPERRLKLVPPLPEPEKSNLAQFSDAKAMKHEEFERVERSTTFYSCDGVPVLTINNVAGMEFVEKGSFKGFWQISTEVGRIGFDVYLVGVDQDGNIVAVRDEYRKKGPKTKRGKSR